MSSQAEFKAGRRRATEPFDLRIHDARHGADGSGDLSTWSLDSHGFAVIPAPPVPASIQACPKLAPEQLADLEGVRDQYYPQLIDEVKRATGATRAFVMAFATRTENPYNPGQSYARFAHTDGTPDLVPDWRKALVWRGVPESEAMTCDIAMYNLWHPFGRPAYQDPLCLLDASSMGPPRAGDGAPAETCEYLLGRSSYEIIMRDLVPRVLNPGFYDELGKRPFYAPGPMYAPGHRWVYLSDQRPDEAWLFKQWDVRDGVAKCTFHTSFHDPAHADQPKETHGRRSCEVRILLVFPTTRMEKAAPGRQAASARL